jgi:hypothetical protein
MVEMLSAACEVNAGALPRYFITTDGTEGVVLFAVSAWVEF